MKIVFLCGSLEPGLDGVGDYTRRLAGELIQNGHNVSAVALYDNYVNDTFIDFQFDRGVSIHVLRINTKLSEKRRFENAKSWIEKYQPQWISLQFVPFAFHSKGLPLFFSKYLKYLINEQFVHVMFHEGWVGPKKVFYIKEFVYSTLQREIIRLILKSINPLIIHTHLPFYEAKLKDMGFKVKSLPVFSNIELCNQENAKNGNIFRVGFFSQMELSVSIVKFLLDLQVEVKKYDKKLEILLIGGKEDNIKGFMSVIGKMESITSPIKVTGYLSSKEISKALQSCTLGITPVPVHALGKSSSVSAFIEHSVPVAAPNLHSGYRFNMIGFYSESLISAIVLEPDLTAIQMARDKVEIARNEIDVSVIAKRMINDLEKPYE